MLIYLLSTDFLTGKNVESEMTLYDVLSLKLQFLSIATKASLDIRKKSLFLVFVFEIV